MISTPLFPLKVQFEMKVLFDPCFYATMVIKAADAIRTTSFVLLTAFPTMTSCITSWTLLSWTIAFRSILTTFGSYWTVIIQSILATLWLMNWTAAFSKRTINWF
jgi:hypothetical protein